MKVICNKGTLGSCIEVHGDWIPRHIFGRFTAACAIIRMVYISFKACIGSFVPDVVFIDGVSSPVPMFQACLILNAGL